MAFFIPSIQFYDAVRHLDSTASYLPTGLHLGFFRSWPPLFLPSSFSSVFLVLSFVSAATSVDSLSWVVFLLPFFKHGHTIRQKRKLVLVNSMGGGLEVELHTI